MKSATIAITILLLIALVAVAIVLRRKTDAVTTYVAPAPPVEEPSVTEPEKVEEKKVICYPKQKAGTDRMFDFVLQEYEPIVPTDSFGNMNIRISDIELDMSKYRCVAEHKITRLYDFDILNKRCDIEITDEAIREENRRRNNRIYVASGSSGTKHSNDKDVTYIDLIGSDSKYVSGEHAAFFIKNNSIQMQVMDGREVFAVPKDGNKICKFKLNPQPLKSEVTLVFGYEILKLIPTHDFYDEDGNKIE